MTTTPDPHVLRPDHAPTPFTAADIRANCRPGRLVTVLVEPADGEPFRRITRFIACDADGADQEFRNLALDGSPLGPAELRRSRWLDLQGHASFPRDATTIEPDTIDLPIGRLDCLRYTVVEGDEVDVFWFALRKPGMPVQVVTRDGAGSVSRVTMVGEAPAADDRPLATDRDP